MQLVLKNFIELPVIAFNYDVFVNLNIVPSNLRLYLTKQSYPYLLRFDSINID